MRILHTSDWHLGKKLFDKDISSSTQQFLDWLRDEIHKQEIDCLIVAGDIFNTAMPSHQAQTQYYQFMASLINSSCKSVVVIAGNHDSASLISAPQEIFKYLNIYVVGDPEFNSDNQVIEIKDGRGIPGAIIGAVPFLRDRDVCRVNEFGTVAEMRRELIDGLKHYYSKVYQAAVEKRGNRELPIVLTGHLFAAGTELSDKEGEGYVVGTLDSVPTEVFPEDAAYIALGHIHRPQVINKNITRNYSGSPYPMNFKEAGQKKYVRVIDFPGGRAEVKSVEIPSFVNLVQIEGTLETIKRKIAELAKAQEEIICEAIIQNEPLATHMTIREIREAAANTQVSVVKFTLSREDSGGFFNNDEESEPLILQMTTQNVFEKRLEIADKSRKEEERFSDRDKAVLWKLYQAVITSLEDNPKKEYFPNDEDFLFPKFILLGEEDNEN